ncbi:hormogonium polysaccharide biosynthesis protein HpsL [Geitlerinema sp. PCC 9228]|uniref:hormogonium polysaccharide biosynthesis protein HpsL n=1 Tax=Geitlerinema sp. PCC 9228 TaxID=111611 RepID=UPI001FCD4712|nr:hormogonium polysaccharide biosynthesis protein HpsL [Geitlerinema sp. PCC 9228]
MAPTKSKAKKKKKKNKKQQNEKPKLSKKEIRQRQKQRQKEIKEFIQFLLPFTALGLLLGGAFYAIDEPKLALAGCGGTIVMALSYKYWRMGMWLFLIYMPFAGTVTYWIAGGNAIFQLAKDGFYIPALMRLVQRCLQTNTPILIVKQLKTPLTLLLIVCALSIIMGNIPDQFDPCSWEKNGRCVPEQPILLGILGLKVFIGYIPLMLCGYYLIRNKKELLFLGRLHVVLAIICCCLGAMQYYMLDSGRCVGTRNLSGEDLFKATLEAKCLVGGSLLFSPQVNMIRLPGTFVAPWQWAWFLIANAFLTFASAFSDSSRLIWRPISMVAMGLVFLNAVISGQRIALALVPTVTVILLVLTGQIANLKRFIPIGVGLGLLLVGAATSNPEVVQQRIDSFVERWQKSPPHQFIVHQFDWATKDDLLFGEGVGRATNAARIFGDTSLVETYYPKIIYEIGLPGALVFLALVTTLVVVGWKTYRSLKDPNISSYGASLWVFLLCISYNTYYYPLDVDPVAVYYWFFAGVLFKLPVIDRQEMERKKQEEEEES